jgi:peptidyl-tRNA hydrolase, PTH2 family|tara:strand:- start:1968 stop:2384 length:417 start_codon:yes stop_codon:yes gene_type:complete
MGLRSFIHKMTAPRAHGVLPRGDLKMVFVVNHSLKMGKGKIAAQVGHGAVQSVMKAGAKKPEYLEAWLASGQKKICVKGDDADHLSRIESQAKQNHILTSSVHDAGHTQIPSGSFTILALGPAESNELEPITGALKLL